ncbi:odorant receptor 21 [Nasonia vitripennis]|uniref:Odorant receptor n=1 Tax=Nasonia vitripennis TaxID=7425 RepID=A0A7M6UDW0_NASVI|nr:odorant receptor 21 [Nasonia vitripennis]
MKIRKSGYDECVGFTRLIMTIIGTWPGAEYSQHWYARYMFSIPLFFSMFFMIIPQTRMLLHVKDDLNYIIEILTTADVMIIVACLKLIGVWYNKKDLRYLLNEIEKDWTITEKEEQHVGNAMWENVKLGKFIMNGYAVLTYGTVVLYAAGMLLLMNSQKIEDFDNENITQSRLMFVRSKFPFETQGSPTFEIIWFLQFLAAVMSIAAFTTFDGFFIFSILHVCAQLVNLQCNFRNLISRCRLTKRTFVQHMRDLVERHIHLQRFTQIIENNFNKVFLMQMIGYSVTLCLQGYQLVISLTENSEQNFITIAFILVYTTANILSLFVYCYVAEKLRKESTEIFYAVCAMPWHEVKPEESKMIVNIMYAAKHPFEITAGKFAVLSFSYFVKVLKTAMGYLSMLLAMKSSHKM